MGQQEENVLDFVPRLSFLPADWRNVGSAYGLKHRFGLAASGRSSFVVREGIDVAELTSTGGVIEGSSDVGVAIKLSTLVIGISAGNLIFRTGLDNPKTALAQRLGENSVPNLKLTASKQFKDENYVAASYDLKTRRPELSACWTGDATTERATLLVRIDPIMRSVKLAAAVSTPGPEWRKVLYNDETELVEEPADDGARHSLYVQHEARGRDLLHATRIGCRLDVGRLVNYAVDFIDYRVEERIPNFLWNIPLLPQLYYLLVPAEDDNQVRHHITGWELDISQDFIRGQRPSLALSKTFKYGTLAAAYDMTAEEAELSYSRKGLKLGTRWGRMDGHGWKKPSLLLSVEPLSLL